MTRARSGMCPARVLRAVVGHTEQLDRVLGVGIRADRDREPAGVGEDVVRAGPARGDQLVAHAAREGKVGDPVAVEVTELAAADAEFDAAEPVRSGLHPRPRLHGFGDLLSGCHGLQTRAAGPCSPDAIGPSTLVACPRPGDSTWSSPEAVTTRSTPPRCSRAPAGRWSCSSAATRSAAPPCRSPPSPGSTCGCPATP